MKPAPLLFIIISVVAVLHYFHYPAKKQVAETASIKLAIPVKNYLQAPPKTIAAPDTSQLKHSGWFAAAINQLAQQEYEFHTVHDSTQYSTPNRSNNLRFFYDKNGFSVQPRTIGIPVGKVDATTRPENIKYRHIPNWKIAFRLNKKQAGDGVWQVAGNKAEYITPNLTVQYINNPTGMRQNFIVHAPLAANEDLKIHFTIATALQTRLQNNRLQFIHKKSGVVLNYDQLKVWDATGKPLEAGFEKSANDYCIHVQSSSAVYPITIDPLSSAPATTVEGNEAGSYYGYSVAGAGDVNGDGYSDVIVGAIDYDGNSTNSGAAFVYHGSATGIPTTAAAMLKGNASQGVAMGYSVASAGDVNGDGYSDVIVGDYKYYTIMPNKYDKGAVYLYLGSASGVSTTAATTVIGEEGAYLGSYVACAGDVNGDGYSDVIAALSFYNTITATRECAKIYLGSSTGMSATPATTITYAGGSVSVAAAGDINSDGYSDVILGLYSYSNGQTSEGALFVYQGSATGITNSPTTTIESNLNYGYWGRYLASAGDVNGDGYGDVVMTSNENQGTVYIFNGSASGLASTPTASVSSYNLMSTQQNTYLGQSIACAGDVNGDGYSDVIVGAYGYDDGETDEGAIYLFQGSASGLNTTPVLKVTSNKTNARMGYSVASAGDVNGDGYSDIITGASGYTNDQSQEGAIFIYHGSAAGCTTTTKVTEESNQAGANLGGSVASAGDINSDGYSDVIVGAINYDNGNTNEGAAFIYLGSAAGLSTTAAARVESNMDNAFLGCSVAGAGDVNGDGYDDVIVGAYQYTNGQNNEGAAYIFHGSASGLSTSAAIILESNQNDALMGYSVAGAGDINADGYSDVIVGAYNYDNGNTNEGAAFIYQGSATGIKATVAARVEGNQNNAVLGSAVASAGDVNGDGYGDVIAGAPGYSNGNTSEGAAFIYQGSATGINTVAAARVEGNQDGANMGISVAGAGDINGDGYSDIAAGASLYDNTQTDEGAVFIYHGSASGINTTAAARLVMNQASANFGLSVAAAGDVNGDGYSDVIVGAMFYANGNALEGGAFIFRGATTGINTTATDTLESNQNFALMSAVAGAGDVNGDGFSDVITGATLYDNGETNEGAAFIYYGNRSAGRRNNLNLYNNDLTTPFNNGIKTGGSGFGAGLFAKSFLGRAKGRLVWETRLNYNAFSGTPITNSVLYTSSQGSYTNLGTTGVELKSLVAKRAGGNYTKIRARIKYDLATAITGQVYSPWRYAPDILLTTSLGALPVDLISFNAQWLEKGKTAQLNFITDNESEVCCYQIERSTDGISFTTIGKVTAQNTGMRTSYSFTDHNAAGKKWYYRLHTSFNNGTAEYSNMQLLQNNTAIEIMVFPNPATNNLQLRLNNSYENMNVQIINSAGQTVKKLNYPSGGAQLITIPVNSLPSGTYFLSLQSGGEKQALQFVKE